MKRYCILCTLLGPLSVTGDSCFADILFESGLLGPTGITFDDFGGGTAPSGSFVSDFAFSAVRFELSQAVVTTRIGGHFVREPGHDPSFFGAVVRLDGPMDFPNSGDLSTPDSLGATLLNFPDSSAEVFGDLQLQLDPGWYGLVFGSGLKGATGRGAAVLNNPDIGSPTYFSHQPALGWFEISPPFGPFENFRLVVVGYMVPEPTSGALIVAVILLGLFSDRRRRVTS